MGKSGLAAAKRARPLLKTMTTQQVSKMLMVAYRQSGWPFDQELSQLLQCLCRMVAACGASVHAANMLCSQYGGL
jgi:hypothetical protein